MTELKEKFLESSIFRMVYFDNYRIGKKSFYLQFKLFGAYWTNWCNFLPNKECSSQTVKVTDFLPFVRQLYENIKEKAKSSSLSQAMDLFYNLLIQLAANSEPPTLSGRTAQCVVIFLSNATYEQKLDELFRLFQTKSSDSILHQEPMVSGFGSN